MLKTNKLNLKQNHLLLLLILLGILVRIYFYIGHVFSDDAYYSYLSYSLLNGDYTDNYLGYPVFPLRIFFIALNSAAFFLFGINETALSAVPFCFSVLNLLLTYKLVKLITDEDQIAILSVFFMSFFPTDIIFSTLSFPDLINVFFINLGIYFLLKSYVEKKILLAYTGGVSLFLSVQFKENIYYISILLVILFVYFFLKKRQFNQQIFIALLFITGNMLFEGFIYLLVHNDFCYRFTVTSLNYSYSFYDFFPYTAQKLSDSQNYFRNLFDQIFLVNAKSIFLRRFYLFLPIVAIVQSYFSMKKKEHPVLIFWFIGTTILLIGFTTSFTEYKPLDLSRSWYIYPVLMPAIILSAILVNKFSKFVKSGLIVIYFVGSLIMCFQYEKFFDKDNLGALNSFLRENISKTIYTDNFTKYSVDLICEYKKNSKRISGTEFNFDKLEKGEWVLFNQKHIEELRLQKYQVPDFTILKSDKFMKTASFNDFIFYEKLY